MIGTYHDNSGWRYQLCNQWGTLSSKKVYQYLATPLSINIYDNNKDYYSLVISDKQGPWVPLRNKPGRTMSVDIMDSTGKFLTFNNIRSLKRISHELLEVEDTLGNYRVINFKGKVLLSGYARLSTVAGNTNVFTFNRGGHDSCVYNEGYRLRMYCI